MFTVKHEIFMAVKFYIFSILLEHLTVENFLTQIFLRGFLTHCKVGLVDGKFAVFRSIAKIAKFKILQLVLTCWLEEYLYEISLKSMHYCLY